MGMTLQHCINFMFLRCIVKRLFLERVQKKKNQMNRELEKALYIQKLRLPSAWLF